MMLKQISSFIKQYPPLFRALRPVFYFGFGRWNALVSQLVVRRAQFMQARIPKMSDAADATSRNRQIGRSASGREVVMLVVSDLRVDPRVEREARALGAAGYDVTVICPEPTKGAGATFNLDWGPRVHIRHADWTAATFMSEQPGYIAEQLYLEAVKRKPFAFHAHDLSTAYAAMAAAKYRGAHLVVDFHEWFSENVHWSTKQSAWAPYPPEWKRALQELEVRCLNEASATITVCDSIADAMKAELGGSRPVVVRNIPDIAVTPSREYPPLKQQLGLPESTFVLLWQGGTGPTRLIEPIIESLAYAPDCIFVIRGPSLDLFGPDYLALAQRVGVEGRVVLAPPVPSKDVVAAARGADAGIWTLPALCRNFTFALPNKIFEYLAADLPVLVAQYAEAKRLVEENAVGLTFDPYNPRSIAESINRMVQDKQLRAAFRASTRTTLAKLDARSEWQKVVSLYDSLSPKKPPQRGSAQ
ncbi:hypothetical protein CK489_35155 [Bradyrhizobium sp. UFLA03-84]|uniref:glycosyltransferase family 4 protein n=1 Tax=Bradyrhizobium sp. UFLA03-84 TaxID=418599 RepID=UPI000BAE4ED3|nr:glycosyltransferase family 4 protein [Bradyrhizobium sp. UFLA03-84]PAY04472.1 hypothetical protein CK489_35155 [Bradyrhizobium sp. UFLA03-84]